MAKASFELIDALRKTANHLKNGADYAWGNHGCCNCGNLLQTVANLSKEEILTYAHTGFGEWTELAMEFCPVSDVPVNLLIKKLTDIGLTPTDIHNLEYLEDRSVLEKLPGGFRWLKRNQKADVIIYFETYAQVLEDQLINEIPISILDLFYSQLPPLPKTVFEPTPIGHRTLETV